MEVVVEDVEVFVLFGRFCLVRTSRCCLVLRAMASCQWRLVLGSCLSIARLKLMKTSFEMVVMPDRLLVVLGVVERD